MAALFGTSANLVTTLTPAAPGPFGSVTNNASAITVNVGTGIAGNNTISLAALSGGDSALLVFPSQVVSANGTVVGTGFQFAANPGGVVTVIQFNGQSSTMALTLTTGGALSIAGATGTALTTGVRHYVEVYVSVFANPAQIIVMVDGQTYLTINNYSGANLGYPVTPQIGPSNGATTSTYIVDSIYHIDTTGAQNNYFLGPRVVTYGIAGGVGQFSAYTPNGAATDWQCVNAIPPPGDTTYASDATAGDQLAVTLTTISGLGSVNFVNVEATVRQEVSAGGRTIAIGVGNGTQTAYGSTRSLSTSYATLNQVFDQNPVVGSPWTVANLATLQAAVETMS